MSVILIDDLKGYSRLLNGIQMFRLAEMQFIQRGTEFSEERAKQLFTLHCLNVKSWNNRYKREEPAEQTYTEDQFINSIVHNRSITDEYTTVEQVLKSLQFLEYQIEDYELKLDYSEEMALKWLRSLITDCTNYLLRKYTQIETAKWGI
jgi:hypothetical protein